VTARTVPPIAFTREELDLLLLGLAMLEREAGEAPDVEEKEDEDAGDEAAAIASARARIAAALPPEPDYRPHPDDTPAQRTILGAIAAEQRLRLSYVDRGGAATQRIVWPIALEGDMLAAWCETRRDYRHFRLDRMRRIQSTGTPMPERRRVLLAGWLRHRSEQGEW